VRLGDGCHQLCKKRGSACVSAVIQILKAKLQGAMRRCGGRHRCNPDIHVQSGKCATAANRTASESSCRLDGFRKCSRPGIASIIEVRNRALAEVSRRSRTYCRVGQSGQERGWKEVRERKQAVRCPESAKGLRLHVKNLRSLALHLGWGPLFSTLTNDPA